MSSSNSAQPTAAEGVPPLSTDDERAIRDLVALADRSQTDAAVLPGLHTDTAAVVSCVKTVYDERPDAERIPPSTGALTYVTVRTSTGWKIGLAQTTPIASD